MPKRVEDLLHPPPPPPPPPPEPHASIVELLKKNPTLAYAAEEIISELRARLPLVFRGGRSVAHVGDVQGALDELVKAGVLTAESDGTAEHYYFQPRTSTATTKR